MKKVLTIAAAVTFLFACNENQEKTNEQPSLTTGKSAVIFYSQTGTTALVARELAKQTHAELVELQMTTPYPSTYDSTVSAVRVPPKLNLENFNKANKGFRQVGWLAQ